VKWSNCLSLVYVTLTPIILVKTQNYLRRVWELVYIFFIKLNIGLNLYDLLNNFLLDNSLKEFLLEKKKSVPKLDVIDICYKILT